MFLYLPQSVAEMEVFYQERNEVFLVFLDFHNRDTNAPPLKSEVNAILTHRTFPYSRPCVAY